MSETLINTAIRDAFLRADISRAPTELVVRIARRLRGNAGAIHRRKLWNKTFSDGPRPKRR